MTTIRKYGEDLKQAVDHMITPTQHNCPYCHYPCKTFRNGDRLIPPNCDSDWWGLMPHWRKDKIGTIMKCDTCPNCGRKLGD